MPSHGMLVRVLWARVNAPCVCVCVMCVCTRARERERQGGWRGRRREKAREYIRIPRFFARMQHAECCIKGGRCLEFQARPAIAGNHNTQGDERKVRKSKDTALSASTLTERFIVPTSPWHGCIFAPSRAYLRYNFVSRAQTRARSPDLDHSSFKRNQGAIKVHYAQTFGRNQGAKQNAQPKTARSF